MEQQNNNYTSTPYDDVHRTLLNDCPKLIIPVVNEMFQRNHSKDEKITLLNNEFFITKQDGKQKERITDTNFLIGSIHYHLECQSSTDGTIMYRIFEYDSQIALQDSAISDNKLVVNFPNSAILYLRHNENTPDWMKIEIRVPEAACSYHVPVMKVQRYTTDELFEKDLLFLLPFHIFAYEKDLNIYESDEDRMQELLNLYGEIVERLNQYVQEGKITEYVKSMLLDMSKKVLEYLAKKHSEVKEKVGAVMGGKILDYEAKDILNAGVRKGLVSIVQKKLTKGDSVEKIAEDLVEDISVIEDIVLQIKGE